MTTPQILRLRAMLTEQATAQVNQAMLRAYAWTDGLTLHARAAAVLAAEELALIAETHAMATRFRRTRTRQGTR